MFTVVETFTYGHSPQEFRIKEFAGKKTAMDFAIGLILCSVEIPPQEMKSALSIEAYFLSSKYNPFWTISIVEEVPSRSE